MKKFILIMTFGTVLILVLLLLNTFESSDQTLDRATSAVSIPKPSPLKTNGSVAQSHGVFPANSEPSGRPLTEEEKRYLRATGRDPDGLVAYEPGEYDSRRAKRTTPVWRVKAGNTTFQTTKEPKLKGGIYTFILENGVEIKAATANLVIIKLPPEK